MVIARSKSNYFTCLYALLPEILYFCYSHDTFEFERISRLSDCTSVDTPRACVINCLLFVEKIFAAEPSICSFGTRTAFLPTLTNYSQLHFSEGRTSETSSEFSCGLVD